MEDLNILVLGAGIAGPVAAYWLARGGARVTLVERSATLPKYGQGLDVEGPARAIVKKMGIWEEMQACATGEAGMAMVDDDGNDIATVPNVLTSDLEIMRGDLVRILCSKAEETGRVEMKFGKKIEELKQAEKVVTVRFQDGEEGVFDVVIGADGLHSRTRSLVFGEEASNAAFQAWDHYAAYFPILAEEGDSPYARVQKAPNGRSALIRPAINGVSSAYLWQRAKSDGLAEAALQTREEQKQALKSVFVDVGGLVPRIIREMEKADCFYFERLAQIHMPSWSIGRCTLVGDAAYCGTPLTGESAHLAILGAYVLAGELSQRPDDPAAAAEAYEKRLRTYVEETQHISSVIPRLAHPTSSFGVWAVRNVFRLVAWSGVFKYIPERSLPFELPHYPAFEKSRMDA